MRTWFNNLFQGRQGMDELSKSMFWWGVACLVISILLALCSTGCSACLSAGWA